jgi:hypothetical protein
VLVCLAGVAVTAVAGVAIRLCRLPRSFFGLCTGYAKPAANRAPALVPWLNDQINEIAQKPSSQPLTFGDLRAAGIALRMMTTCLTWGRPFTLPFDTGAFYFSPKEFRSFFPEEVVKWMEDNPPKNLEPAARTGGYDGITSSARWRQPSCYRSRHLKIRNEGESNAKSHRKSARQQAANKEPEKDSFRKQEQIGRHPRHASQRGSHQGRPPSEAAALTRIFKWPGNWQFVCGLTKALQGGLGRIAMFGISF